MRQTSLKWTRLIYTFVWRCVRIFCVLFFFAKRIKYYKTTFPHMVSVSFDVFFFNDNFSFLAITNNTQRRDQFYCLLLSFDWYVFVSIYGSYKDLPFWTCRIRIEKQLLRTNHTRYTIKINVVDDKHTLCKRNEWRVYRRIDGISNRNAMRISVHWVCVCVIVTLCETGVLYSKSLPNDRNDWIPRSFTIIKTVRIRGTARFFYWTYCVKRFYD